MSRIVLCIAAIAVAAPAHAALMIDIQSESISASTAALDVLISGNGTTDVLGAFTLTFQITSEPGNPTAGTPLFVAPPSDPTQDSTLTDPNYIFHGNSLDLDTILGPTAFGHTSAGGTAITLADSTDNLLDVIVGSSKLLARLEFTVPSGLAGDKFDITLTNPTTALQSNANLLANLPVTGTGPSGAFEGTVTVTPEPGTLGMVLAGVIGLACMNRKRRVVPR